MAKYKISILTLQGKTNNHSGILTYHVDNYTIDKGDFIHFVDQKTGRNLRFHASRAEIEELSAV